MGIVKNVVCGKLFFLGIVKKILLVFMINDLFYYLGYEWWVVGDDLVLVVLSIVIVIVVINGVFD